MSEFHPRVIKIEEIKVHPYADLLEIVEVDGGYPCCIQKGTYNVGDTAVYIPVGAMVDSDHPLFSFLDKNDKGGYIRIKALKLREIFSMGLIVNNIGNWPVDYEPIEELRIRKYEPPEPKGDEDIGSELELFPHYDLDPLRKYHTSFGIGEKVVITEKIHGCVKHDTKVRLQDGTEKELKDLIIGDVVKSYDVKSSSFKDDIIKNIFTNNNTKDWVELYFDNGRSLVCTEDHRILTSNRGWICAIDLEEYDNIIGD